VIWGVFVSIYIIVVQGETVRPRATAMGKNGVDYLLANPALGITIPFGYAAKAPAIRWSF